jgi:hypothetical protein
MANAGVYEFGRLGEITEEQFDKTFNTDVRGLLFTVQKALPLPARGSSVILTGSMVSIKGFASCLHHPLTIGLTGLGCDGAVIGLGDEESAVALGRCDGPMPGRGLGRR